MIGPITLDAKRAGERSASECLRLATFALCALLSAAEARAAGPGAEALMEILTSNAGWAAFIETTPVSAAGMRDVATGGGRYQPH